MPWTVMVYMGADNLPTERDLTKAAHDDIDEMVAGANPNATVLVQVDDSSVGHARRFEVTGNGLVAQSFAGENAPIDMASASVFADFLDWGFSYANDHYLLVLWGHAYRFAFGYDASAKGDALDFHRLSGVLRTFAAHGRRLDVLGFDACGVSAIEIAYELRTSVDYLIASEAPVPLLGWPYATILGRIAANGDIDPPTFSRGIVDDYLTSLAGRTVMLAAISLAPANYQQIVDRMRLLSASLAVGLADRVERAAIVASFEYAAFTDREPLVDLAQLCGALRTISTDKDTRAAAADMLALLDDKTFVIALDRRGKALEGLGGISAYAPHVAPPSVRVTIDSRYNQLDLALDTLWPAVVKFLDLAT